MVLTFCVAWKHKEVIRQNRPWGLWIWNADAKVRLREPHLHNKAANYYLAIKLGLEQRLDLICTYLVSVSPYTRLRTVKLRPTASHALAPADATSGEEEVASWADIARRETLGSDAKSIWELQICVSQSHAPVRVLGLGLERVIGTRISIYEPHVPPAPTFCWREDEAQLGGPPYVLLLLSRRATNRPSTSLTADYHQQSRIRKSNQNLSNV